MKKYVFVFAGLCFCINAIAQTETKVPFAEVIKISPKDSFIKIEPEAKKLLDKIVKEQSRQKKENPIRLFFNISQKAENIKMGKWMAAHLRQDLYKVNLSSVISKYIGETEKNIDKVFDEAAKRNQILFFDEADALFGKKTTVKDSHDKYANQEISYLMNRINKFTGTVFIHCRVKDCIDSAMLPTFIKVGGKQE